MSYRNLVILEGFLGADPTARELPSGELVVNARLATKEAWTDAQGRHEHTEWHSLVCYGGAARRARTYSKGDNVYAEGRLQTRQFTDSDNRQRTHREIVVLRTYRIQRDERDAENGGDAQGQDGAAGAEPRSAAPAASQSPANFPPVC